MKMIAKHGLTRLVDDLRQMITLGKSFLRWVGATRGRKITFSVLLLVIVLMIIDLSMAIADDPICISCDSGDPLRMLTDATDSHGLYLDHFSIDTDRGGVTNLWNMFASGILWFFFDVLYRSVMAIALWMLDIVTGFIWMEVLRAPAEALSGVLNTLVNDLGLIPLLLVVSVLVSSFWILRGRAGAGFGEMAVALVVAALLTTWVASPVTRVAGPDGMIEHARQLGVAITGDLLGYGDGEEADSDTLPTTALMDNLVRRPHQLINYGDDLDARGADCSRAYNRHVVGGDVDLASACGEDVMERVDNPGDGVMPALFVMPASIGLLLLILVILAGLLLVCVLITWESAKFVLEMLKAILPGANRAGLMTSIVAIVIGLGLLIGGLMTLGLVVRAIEALFDETTGWSAIVVFAFIDLILFVACIAFVVLMLRGWKSRRKVGQKMADALSPKPSPAKMPSRTGAMTLGMAKGAVASKVLNRSTRAAASPPNGTVPGGNGADGAPMPSEKRSKLAAAGSAAKTAGVGALAYTVGAPVAVPRAAATAKAALAARKSHMKEKLGEAKQKVGEAKAGALEYGKEYAQNVGKYSGATWAATKLASGDQEAPDQPQQDPDPRQSSKQREEHQYSKPRPVKPRAGDQPGGHSTAEATAGLGRLDVAHAPTPPPSGSVARNRTPRPDVRDQKRPANNAVEPSSAASKGSKGAEPPKPATPGPARPAAPSSKVQKKRPVQPASGDQKADTSPAAPARREPRPAPTSASVPSAPTPVGEKPGEQQQSAAKRLQQRMQETQRRATPAPNSRAARPRRMENRTGSVPSPTTIKGA